MTILVPSTMLAQPLISGLADFCEQGGHRLIVASEMECARLMLANSADLALLTPLGYGLGVLRADYRIVPTSTVFLHDFTNVAGISFADSGGTLATCTSSAPDDFLPTLAVVIMSEKFDLDVKVAKGTGGNCHVDYSSPDRTNVMDVSEEYADMLESPLPAYLWVCRSEADQRTVEDLVKSFPGVPTQDVLIVEQVPASSDHFPRDGRISFTWSGESEEALATMLELLFYHQLLPEIPAVKLLGRD